MDGQTDVAGYFLPNLTQIGSVQLPYPSLKVPTRTYLMDNETVRQEVKQSLYSPTPELAQRLGTLLENTDISHLYGLHQLYSSLGTSISKSMHPAKCHLPCLRA